MESMRATTNGHRPVQAEDLRDQTPELDLIGDDLLGVPSPSAEPQVERTIAAEPDGDEPMIGDEGDSTSLLGRAQLMGPRFLERGLAAYDTLLIGDRRAKIQALAQLAMGAENGMIGAYFGDPGTGKSQLLRHFYGIVQGIESQQVGRIPHREDLSPAKVTGELTELEREYIEGDETKRKEILRNMLSPILHPGIKVVTADEINRASPWVHNAFAEIAQDGGVTTWDAAGNQQRLSAFEAVAAAQNSYGTKWTHGLDPMMLNRLGMGVFVGDRARGELDEAGEDIFDEEDNEQYVGLRSLNPIIRLDRLHEMREGINLVRFDRDQRELGKRLLVNILDAMQDHGIRSGSPRMGHQIKRMARTLSLLEGEAKVTDPALCEAARYALTARLGGASVMPPRDKQNMSPEQYIDSVIDSAIANAKSEARLKIESLEAAETELGA